MQNVDFDMALEVSLPESLAFRGYVFSSAFPPSDDIL